MEPRRASGCALRSFPALRQNDLDVVAIHQHMLQENLGEPVVIFLHYWGTGPADKLATGFKAALDELGHRAHHSE